jgi:purine-binding chemotaxis protein CheW
VSQAGNQRPTLVFDLGDRAFGVRLQAVREIAEVESIQPVPRSPSVILGLAGVRGRLTTVINLPAMVEAPAAEGAGRLLILSEPLDHLALWTASEISLLELDLESLKPGPEPGARHDVIDGRGACNGTQVHLLSAEKLLLACEKEILKRYRMH